MYAKIREENDDVRINEEVGDGIVGGEEARGLVGLLDDGVDVVDVSDGFQHLFLLVPIEPTLVFGLLGHLVVVLHQGPSQRRLVVLPHLSLLENRTQVVPMGFCLCDFAK